MTDTLKLSIRRRKKSRQHTPQKTLKQMKKWRKATRSMVHHQQNQFANYWCSKWRKKGYGGEKAYLKKGWLKASQVKSLHVQIHEVFRRPNKTNIKSSSPTHIIIKIQQSKEKKVLKASWENKPWNLQSNMTLSRFLSRNLTGQRKKGLHIPGAESENCQPKLLYLENIILKWIEDEDFPRATNTEGIEHN